MSSRKLKMSCALLAALWLAVWAPAQSSSRTRSGEFEWRFSIRPDRVVSSGITAENSCSSDLRFEIDLEHLPAFVRVRGEAGAMVASHDKHNFPVQFDSTGLAAGTHQGSVMIKCVTCRKNGCSKDREVLQIYMTVEGERAGPAYVRDRVLVVIPFDSDEGVEAAAKKLAAKHGLLAGEIHRLDSIHAALIAFVLPQGSDVAAKVAELLQEVLIAEPDYLFTTNDGASAQENSALAKVEYGPKLIHADRLQGSLSGKGVRVAIVDSGIDVNNPALKGKVVEQFDATGKGLTADVHGTMLAGIIAADPGNSGGVHGIAPAAEIVAIKACQPETAQAIQAQCSVVTLAQGLDFAIQKKARIINFSLSGPGEKLLQRLLDVALNQGIVVVAAAGNDGPHGRPGFLAALPRVIAVTAVDAGEHLYPLATQGDFIAVAAPGVEVVSIAPGGSLQVSSGTSFAAAFVSGTAALMIEQKPGVTPTELRSLLERTAKDLGPPGKDPQFGSGLVDACRATQVCR